MRITRRGFLGGVGGAVGAVLVGCDTAAIPTPLPPRDMTAPPCVAPSTGPGLSYCLVENSLLRISGGTHLTVGAVTLFNVDDNSAAIVARDEKGFYALSGICTHQCCVLTVCDNRSCTSLLTNPGDCKATPVGALQRPGAAFLCACHGSEFAADGTVLSGPAVRALPPVVVRRDGKDLVVDLGSPAALHDRTL